LWDDEIIPLERTCAIVEQSETAFAERHAGLWVAWSRGAPALIGYGALWPFRKTQNLELLYGVAEPFWGKGYAAEIGRAVVDYCFDALAMTMVNASTDVDNMQSRRVLEKLGFACIRRSKVEDRDTMFYELARR
jgi:RimJ/RimL family protein N-acetyltransferase